MFGIPMDGSLTAPAILGIGFVMIMTGLLVPYRFYKVVVEERDRWIKNYEIERAARIEADKQSSAMLEAQKTTHALIVAIFENSKSRREDRDAVS